MEIKITDFWNDGDMQRYSASRAELGDKAAEVTFHSAKEAVPDYLKRLPKGGIKAVRDWLLEFGEWDSYTDIDKGDMDGQTCRALLLQIIAGDIREATALIDKDTTDWTDKEWEEYQKLSDEGTVSGRLFKGIDNHIYFYVGG